MKTLVVGGTGGIGGNIALALQAVGHQVTLAARHRAQSDTPVAGMPNCSAVMRMATSHARSSPLSSIVFSACNDPRQLPPGATAEQEAEFYHRVNSVGVPRFVALARDAGVRRVAYIGSLLSTGSADLIPTSSTSSLGSRPTKAHARWRDRSSAS